MQKLFVLVLIQFALLGSINAQGVTIGANTPPDASAVLDLQDTARGFLLPRLNTAQRNAIAQPADGLQIYNTTDHCVQIFMPLSGWRDLLCDCNSFPNAQFSYPSTLLSGSPITFTPASSGLFYSWSFQGGTPASSTAEQPSVTFGQGGSYAVNLTVTDQLGCSASFADTVQVINCVTGGSVTLNTCGNTGRTGPSQNQCNAQYGNGVVSVSNGYQIWTVPNGVCSLTVEAWGAQGGTSSTNNVAGGLGGYVKGDFAVQGGDQLLILVGQRGESGNGGGNWWAAGGGGATVVAFGTNPASAAPWMVAGGGGGAGISSGEVGGAGGATLSIGGNGNAGTGSGNGGSAGSGYHSSAGNGSESFVNGGGGANNNGYCSTCGIGGFGGGGVGGGNPGGGGGGYVGGNYGSNSSQPGSGYNRGGMGGTSFNTGSNPSNQSGQRTGTGQVVITW